MTTNEWKRRCERQREEKKVTRVRNVPEDEQHAVVRSCSLVDSLPSRTHAIRHNRSLVAMAISIRCATVRGNAATVAGSSIIKRYIMVMIDIDSSIIKRYHDDD